MATLDLDDGEKQGKGRDEDAEARDSIEPALEVVDRAAYQAAVGISKRGVLDFAIEVV